jgi:hypothetical protein
LAACERWRWGLGGIEVGLASPTYDPLGLIFVSCVPNSIFFPKNIYSYFISQRRMAVV